VSADSGRSAEGNFNMRILIAEDVAALQLMAGELMKHWGFEFDIVSNGQEAVDQAKANEGKYDLCLMDIDMPIMNGWEATKIIRRNLNYFPIMALTGNLRAKEEYLAIGMDDFLGKPYSIENLYQKINELTVKFYKFKINDNDIFIKKEMPMDQQHAQELKKLKEQHLVKMRLDGPEQQEVIAHENTPYKISHDFNHKKYLMTEFLNRDPERPTLCDLYRGTKNCIVETFLDENDYAKKLASEDLEMTKHTQKIYKAEED